LGRQDKAVLALHNQPHEVLLQNVLSVKNSASALLDSLLQLQTNSCNHISNRLNLHEALAA
jgi:hypothetical protein